MPKLKLKKNQPAKRKSKKVIVDHTAIGLLKIAREALETYREHVTPPKRSSDEEYYLEAQVGGILEDVNDLIRSTTEEE